MTKVLALEFRVLGPLEAALGGTTPPLGGGKQRAVLAALLLRAGEVVPVDRLVDEVWGDDPPPSAAHSLEAYVSRIRQLLNGHGPRLLRRGAGYVLELGDATLDAREFEQLAEEAWTAGAEGRFEDSARLAARALALWRGPALADVALASAGRADADRLEELRLRVHEHRFEAELSLGRHESVVGELQKLVGQSPYRERFVAQLMLALYRAGRHAEALEVYELTRRRLDDDLGLQPSVELRELSGQIVRQDRQLIPPRLHPSDADRLEQRGSSRGGRMAALVLAASVTAAVMAFAASGSASYRTSTAAATAAERVALVVARSPETSIDEPAIRETAEAFLRSVDAWDLEGHVLVAGEDGGSAQAEHVTDLLEGGAYALAIVVGDTTARALAPVVRSSSATRFVFLDASLSTLSLGGAPNATGMPFADEETSYLMGFLSGLVPRRGVRPGRRADAISIVVSKETPRAERLAHAFRKGVRRAAPRASVRVAYVTDETDKTACERLANDLVDAGSDVVYAAAGECSSSVLAVVNLRGIWGIRANDDPFAYGQHLLATTYKRWDQAARAALNGFGLGTLPRGRDVVLGLADDYAVEAWSSGVSESEAVWSKVAHLCTTIRARTKDDAL